MLSQNSIGPHYENCSFSSHQPTPRNIRSREHFDEQVAQQLQESLASAAPNDPIAVARLNRPLLPMYDNNGRPLFLSLPFNTPGVNNPERSRGQPVGVQKSRSVAATARRMHVDIDGEYTGNKGILEWSPSWMIWLWYQIQTAKISMSTVSARRTSG